MGRRLLLRQSKDLEEAVLPRATLSGFKGLLFYLPGGGFSFRKERALLPAQAADRPLPSAARREGPPEAPDDVMMSEGSSVMPGGGRSPATWEVRLEEPEGGRGVGAPRVKGPD